MNSTQDSRDEDQCASCGCDLQGDLPAGHFGLCETCLDDNDDDDFLDGVTCNPDAPEECESCQ